MSYIVYYILRGFIGGLRRLPLTWVARLGRAGGALAFMLDRRHRRVAMDNLTECLGRERSARDLRELARENFKRIGENFACAIKTSAMDEPAIRRCVELTGAEKVPAAGGPGNPRGRIIIIGHFGNFEIYARCNYFVPGYPFATTYRGLNQPVFDRLLQDMRRQSGCLYFERRSDAAGLREALLHQRVMVGLLVDQHAGDRGLPVPFFGRACSTSAAPALYALRYECPLLSAICYRIGLGRWRVEIGDEIPTRENGVPRAPEAITADINRVLEAAIRRDPANWFWVHRRWKPMQRQARAAKPVAASPELE